MGCDRSADHLPVRQVAIRPREASGRSRSGLQLVSDVRHSVEWSTGTKR